MSKNKKNDEMDRNGQLLAENRENSTEEVKSDSYKLGYTWFIFFLSIRIVKIIILYYSHAEHNW